MARTTLRDQFTPEQRAEWKPKIIARNTFKFVRDGETVVRLHRTDIVRKLADGSVILTSGGWQTLTTKERMNAQMPAGASIYQAKGLWYVARGYWSDPSRVTVPYFDGIQVPQCFDNPPNVSAIDAKKKLAKDIAKFVKRLDTLSALPVPNAGDCWYCSMFQREQKPGGAYACTEAGDTEHLLSHIKEGYIHGSLLVNAMTWAGRLDSGLIYRVGMRDIIKRDLRRYLRRKLGLG